MSRTVQDDAVAALELLREKGWSKLGGRHCLFTASRSRRLDKAMAEVIAARYPGRTGKGPLGYPEPAAAVVAFNDHPGTRWDDVEGVLQAVIAP